MTASTGVHLGPGARRANPLGDAPGGVLHLPGARPAVEANQEPGRPGLGPGSPPRPGPGPGPVSRPRPVAGLAAQRQLGPRGAVLVRGRVVPLAEVRGVALRALVVPGLLPAAPVQRVGGVDPLARVQREPALAAGRPGTRVPGRRQRLEPPARERNQVLLKGIDAEGVGNLILGRLAVGTLGPDQVLAVPAEKGGGDPLVGEPRSAEVAEDRGRAGRLHGPVVIRAPEGLGLLRMAGRARGAPHEGRHRRRRGRPSGALLLARAPRAGGGEHPDRDQPGDGSPHDAPRMRRTREMVKVTGPAKPAFGIRWRSCPARSTPPPSTPSTATVQRSRRCGSR